MIKKIKIDNIELDNNLLLAPLAGITIKPFRKCIKQFGAGLVYTEMISIHGLVYDNAKTKHMLDMDDDERPVCVQLFGNDPDKFRDAAKIVEDMGADLIDINMGCPSAKIVNGGSGSALLKDTKKVREILYKVVGSVKIPVIVKIRSGWDESSINALEVGKIAEDEGIKMIAIHGRTKSQKFGPNFDWSIIKKLKDILKIPVIGNGNVFTVYDAKQMFAETGCDGIMIGRGAYYNPWLFKQILEFYETGEYTDVLLDEKIDFIIEFINNLAAYRGEKGIVEARKFIGWFTKNMRFSHELRKQCFQLSAAEDVIQVLRKYKDKSEE
ncbi:tRNA dihydrouridine synthase DusB [bacterium]